jgi:hypothetical protein
MSSNSNIRVFKYPIPIDDVVGVTMPVGAEILSVGWQPGDPHHIQLWARVDTTQPKGEFWFRVVGTGHPNAVGIFVGTVLMHEGALVFHVFRLPEGRPA